MNKLLMEENDRLQKQVSRLVFDNGYMKNRLHSVSSFSLFNCTWAWTKNGLVSWCMACCILSSVYYSIVCMPVIVFSPLLMHYLILLAVTFAYKFAAFCSHHRHKLWVCGDKWSAQPTAKPSSSASSTKGCEQPSRVSLKPDYIRVQKNSHQNPFLLPFFTHRTHILIMLALMLIFLLSSLLAIAEETLAEFMSKATGTAVNWVQMVGMKVMYLFF
jgi:hypothetical protein